MQLLEVIDCGVSPFDKYPYKARVLATSENARPVFEALKKMNAGMHLKFWNTPFESVIGDIIMYKKPHGWLKVD